LQASRSRARSSSLRNRVLVVLGPALDPAARVVPSLRGDPSTYRPGEDGANRGVVSVDSRRRKRPRLGLEDRAAVGILAGPVPAVASGQVLERGVQVVIGDLVDVQLTHFRGAPGQPLHARRVAAGVSRHVEVDEPRH